MVDAGLRETLIGIASVSAVFWTGGLIVIQLRSSRPSSPQDTKATDTVRSAMACIAFASLAPLFAIATSDTVMRVIAAVSMMLYYFATHRNVRDIRNGLKSRDWYSVLVAFGFLAPTLAMLLVSLLRFSPARTVLGESLVFDFLGYYMLQSQIVFFAPVRGIAKGGQPQQTGMAQGTVAPPTPGR